jgi:hypothetical protein
MALHNFALRNKIRRFPVLKKRYHQPVTSELVYEMLEEEGH